jgi:hypothetical protein
MSFSPTRNNGSLFTTQARRQMDPGRLGEAPAHWGVGTPGSLAHRPRESHQELAGPRQSGEGPDRVPSSNLVLSFLSLCHGNRMGWDRVGWGGVQKGALARKRSPSII